MDSRRGLGLNNNYSHPRAHRYMNEHINSNSDYVRHDQRRPHENFSGYGSWGGPPRNVSYFEGETLLAQRPSYGSYHHEYYNTHRFQRPQSQPVPDTVYSRYTPNMRPPMAYSGYGQHLPTVHGQGYNMSPQKGRNVHERHQWVNRVIPCSTQTTNQQTSSPFVKGKSCSGPKQSQNMKDSPVSQNKQIPVLSPRASEVGKTVIKQLPHGETVSTQSSPDQENSLKTDDRKSQGSPFFSVKCRLEQSKHSSPPNKADKPLVIDTEETKDSPTIGSHSDVIVTDKYDTPKLVEVELMSKLKNIDLCTSKEVNENDVLVDKSTSAILEEQHKSECTGQKDTSEGTPSNEGNIINSKDITNGVEDMGGNLKVTEEETTYEKYTSEEKPVETNIEIEGPELKSYSDESENLTKDVNGLEHDGKPVKSEGSSSSNSVHNACKEESGPEEKGIEKKLIEEYGSKPGVLSESSFSAVEIDNTTNSELSYMEENDDNEAKDIRFENETSFLDNTSSKLILSPMLSLQNKVMEKVRKKSSLVKIMSDHSLKVMMNDDIIVNGNQNDQQYIDGASEVTQHLTDVNSTDMEVDDSFDNYADLADEDGPGITENSVNTEDNQKEGWKAEEQNGDILSSEKCQAYEGADCTEEISEYRKSLDNKSVVRDIGCEDPDKTEYNINILSEDANNILYKGFEGDKSIESCTCKESLMEGSVGSGTVGEDVQIDTTKTEAVATYEGLDGPNDEELKKKFSIKEVFVSLGKVDTEAGREDMKDVEDKENKPVHSEHIDDNSKGLIRNFGRLEIDICQNIKDPIAYPNELEKDVSGNSRHLGSESGELELDLPQEIEESKRADKEKPVHSEGCWKQTVTLSDRFSLVSDKYGKTEADIDVEEEVYKAEFENILKKLKKKSELTETPSGNSETGVEEMEVQGKEVNREDEKGKENVDMNGSTNHGLDLCSQGSVKMKEGTGVTYDSLLRGSSPVSFLDYSDESDDELLRAPSAFLRSIEEINSRPVVITPTKVVDSSQSSTATTSSNDLSPVKSVAQRPGVKNKFTLDGLIADHEDKVDLVKEMDEINQELQDEIKSGGFVNLLNKEDAATDFHITEEQKEMLKQFEVQESHICEDRPGVLVFEPQQYKCLFSSMLHPTHCGFTVGSNGLQLEKHLESLVPSQYKRVITSDIIYQCYTRISCQTPLLRWIFFIMSIHEDYQVQQGCKKILLEILHYQHIYCQQKWAPRLVDVVSVLVNYGASLESIVPCGSSTLDIIRGKLIQEPGYTQPPAVQDNEGVKVENLILVLQILAQCLHGPSGIYSPNDLSLLCVALCKASLDTSLKNMCAKGVFQNCITMVIRQYLEADWLKERLKLTRMLVSITDHHHNSVHIAELLPPGERGMFLQRRFCFLALSDILLEKTNVSDEVLESVQIRDLGVFVPKLEVVLVSDTYLMSSVVMLIDLCVGVHLTMKSEQREQLKSLLEQVRRVRVRDNVSMLDRTRVKDMIVRMTSKWSLDIQTMKGKQTKIFEFASPMRMYIEPVKVSQSGSEEEEHSDSDNDLPHKIQKLY